MEITPAETRLHFELITQEDSETKSQKYQPVVLGPKAGCHRQNSYNLSNSAKLISPGRTELASKGSKAQTNIFKRYIQNAETPPRLSILSKKPQCG